MKSQQNWRKKTPRKTLVKRLKRLFFAWIDVINHFSASDKPLGNSHGVIECHLFYVGFFFACLFVYWFVFCRYAGFQLPLHQLF